MDYTQAVARPEDTATPILQTDPAFATLDPFNLSGNSTGNITGPSPTKVLPIEERIVLILLYTFTAVAAVFGNVLVIIVFTCGRRRTDLRPFLINLAVADLIMAVFCIPFTTTNTMLGKWIFSPPMCPIVLYLQLVSVTASVSTNMAIGIDRFWVVTFPLKSRVTAKRYKIVIAIIWLISMSLSSIQLLVGRTIRHEVGPNQVDYECTEIWWEPQKVLRRAYTIIILTLTYIIPLFILSLTYGIVARKLWQRTAPGNKDASRDAQQLKSKRKVVKMLVTVVALFGVCWLPIHTFSLVIDNTSIMNSPSARVLRILTAIYYTVHWLAMSNSFVNPIIYGFLNDSFRADLLYLWWLAFPCCKCCPCVRHPVIQRSTTTAASAYRGYTRYTRRDSSSIGGGSNTSRGESRKKLLKVRMNGNGRVEHETELDARDTLLVKGHHSNGKHAAV